MPMSFVFTQSKKWEGERPFLPLGGTSSLNTCPECFPKWEDPNLAKIQKSGRMDEAFPSADHIATLWLVQHIASRLGVCVDLYACQYTRMLRNIYI